MAEQNIAQWQTLDQGTEAGVIVPSASFSIHSVSPLLFNCFSLKRGDSYHIQQRPLMESAQFADAANGTFRGFYYWPVADKIYYVIGASLYSLDNDFSTITTLTSSLDTTAAFVGFAELNTGSERYLILLDGVKGWYIASAAPTTEVQITDGDFPTPHITTPVCFDGYVFVAKSGTQDIYNSAAADPTSWAASTFIRSEQYSSNLVAIAKHQNQLVAFHTDGMTFFKNAGIAAPNSPLQRIVELSQDVGLPFYHNLRPHSDSLLYFLGTGNNFAGGVYQLENSKLNQIASPIFEQIITTYSEFASFGSNRRLLSLEWFGQTFLLWEPTSPTAAGAARISMVLNAKTGQLSFWGSRDPDASSTPAFDAASAFPLPFGIIDITKNDDTFYGWSYLSSTNSDPIKVFGTGLVQPKTLLIWHFNTDLFDESDTYAFTGDDAVVTLSAVQAKFGAGSAASAVNGVDTTSTTPVFPDYDLIRTEDWTLDGWFFTAWPGAGARPAGLLRMNDTSFSTAAAATLDIDNQNNTVTATMTRESDGNAVLNTGAAAVTLADNTWYHWAFVHYADPGRYSFYFNGNRIATALSTDAPQTGNLIWMGGDTATTTVYWDEIRLSHGARFEGATYTIPTAEGF